MDLFSVARAPRHTSVSLAVRSPLRSATVRRTSTLLLALLVGAASLVLLPPSVNPLEQVDPSKPAAAYTDQGTNPWSPIATAADGSTSTSVSLFGGSFTAGIGATPLAPSTGADIRLTSSAVTISNAGGSTPAMRDPQIADTTAGVAFRIGAPNRPGCLMTVPITSGPPLVCSDLGELTFTFSTPVTNPVIHVTGIGGTTNDGAVWRTFSQRLRLVDSTPAGVSLGSLSSGATNLALSGGDTLQVINGRTQTSCVGPPTGLGVQAVAGCGSVRVQGTVTSVTFRVDGLLMGNSPGYVAVGDGAIYTVSYDQDYSDAPASYGAPRTVLGGPRLGSLIDAEYPGQRSPAASPFAGAAATGDDLDGIDDEDGVASFPPLNSAMGGSTYTVPVAVSGITTAQRLCGWLDFERNGTFEADERQCVAVPVGATAVNVPFTVTSDVQTGATYARFQLGATDALITTAGTATAGIGEVEDYALTITNTALQCRSGIVYALGDDGAIYAVNTATGAMTLQAQAQGTPDGPYNGLAITTDASTFYLVRDPAPAAPVPISIYTVDAATNVTQSTSAGVSQADVNRGTFNPANGKYYWSYNVAGQPAQFRVYDPATNTAYGNPPAFTTVPGGFMGTSGDIVFDALGNLYIVQGASDGTTRSAIYRYDAPLPEANEGWVLPRTLVATIPAGGMGGITFDSDGYLYASTTTALYKIDPATGSILTTTPFTLGGAPYAGIVHDLADCDLNPTLELHKDIVERSAATDQFRLTITGSGYVAGTAGNTGQTTGTAPGLQEDVGEVAGAVPVREGQTYTLTETANPGTLGNYTTTIACLDLANGNATVAVTPVSQGVSTLTVPNGFDPPNISCTYTNTPRAAVTVDKTVVGTPVANGDGTYTVTYDINVDNSGGAGAYDLDDALRFGGGITVDGATVANTSPGSITTDPAWDGLAATRVVTGQAIAAGAGHRYRVTVLATLATTITTEAGDCTLSTTETGTGFLNTATVTHDQTEVTDTACGEPGIVTVAKELVGSPVHEADGSWTVRYRLTASNVGGASSYDLDDTLQYGSGMVIRDATVTNAKPGTIDTNPGWDGVADTSVVSAQAIGADATHSYEVTVESRCPRRSAAKPATAR